MKEESFVKKNHIISLGSDFNADTASPTDMIKWEVYSSWWAPYVSNAWIQNIAGKYIAWKVGRKWHRFEYSLHMRDMLRRQPVSVSKSSDIDSKSSDTGDRDLGSTDKVPE